MGCGQSTADVAEVKEKYVKDEEPGKMNKAPPSTSTGHSKHTHAFGVVTDKQIAEAKIAELEKCMLQIGERSESECDPPQVQMDFDSWKHKVDSADVQAMKEGHVLPMNRSAHHHYVKKTHKSLVELVEDPSALKRAIKMRRMELEEVVNYKAASSLNAIPDEDKFKGNNPKRSQVEGEVPRKSRLEML